MDLLHPDIPRQQGVKRPPQSSRIVSPPPVRQESDPLTERMHTSVGASCASGCRTTARQPLEHGLELCLHGAPVLLALPPDELDPIVMHHGEGWPARHDAKDRKNEYLLPSHQL